MKAYAQITDFGRSVSVMLERPSEQPGCIQIAGMPKTTRVSPPEEGGGAPVITEHPTFLWDIESQMEWRDLSKRTPFVGNESIYLPTEQVQTIFDALWRAGMRPTR